MKYLIFSDIHGNASSFRQFLADVNKLQYDRIIFLGDFIGYYYDSEEIIRYCQNNNVTCLLGNHDNNFLRMLKGELEEDVMVAKYGSSYLRAKKTISKQSIEFLTSLKTSLVLTDEFSLKLFFCHGSPLDLLNGRVYPDTDLSQFESLVSGYSYVILGHTHHKMIRKHQDVIYLNPGSLGQQRDGQGCSFILLDTQKGPNFKIVSYDIDRIESQIEQYDNGNMQLMSVLRRSAKVFKGSL